MRIFYFSTGVTILLDILLWFIISISVAWLCLKMPDRFFAVDQGIFTNRTWEAGGAFYQRVFKVKKWKGWLPDGGGFFQRGFAKKKLARTDAGYIRQFILETRRAELTHWLQILPVPLFFLFNEWWVGIIMIVYALCANLPCIIAQRYNRIRMMKFAR